MKKSIDLEQLEGWVRAGHFSKVEGALRALPQKKLPRELVLPVANMARRVNLFLFALKILNPIVRAEVHSKQLPATAAEKIEYAESLRKLGAVEEARQILTDINADEFPQALLYESFCHFSQWRYENTLPLLRRYVEFDGLSEYQRLVGKINLAAALVHQSQQREAQDLLGSLREQTYRGEHFLLFGNSLELSAQLEIQKNKWDQAYLHLDKAEAVLKKSSSIEVLWVRKWRAIASSLQKQEVTNDLKEITEIARQSGHWETWRDCTFRIAMLNRDSQLLSKVYFGTPFSSYRETMMKSVGDWFQPDDSFLFTREDRKPQQILDLASGRLDSGSEVISPGQAHHRLLVLLGSDVFRPLPLVAAFAQMFPNEYFNALSSPSRVHQSVRRLRRLIEDEDLDFEISESQGAYRIELMGNLALRLRVESAPENQKERHLRLVLGAYGTEEFSVSQVQQVLGASTSTSQRLLRWAVSENKLQASGVGPRTRYKAA